MGGNGVAEGILVSASTYALVTNRALPSIADVLAAYPRWVILRSNVLHQMIETSVTRDD